jgi:hypothetical protein
MPDQQMRPVNEAMMYVLHTPLPLQADQRSLLSAIAERMGPLNRPCALSDPALAAATGIAVGKISALVATLVRRRMLVVDPDPHVAFAPRYSINLRTFERAGIRVVWPTRQQPSVDHGTHGTAREGSSGRDAASGRRARG